MEAQNNNGDYKKFDIVSHGSVEFVNLDSGVKTEKKVSITRAFQSQITKETQVEAFEEIRKTLGERYKNVLNCLEDIFPTGATAKEVANYLHSVGLVDSPERNSAHPRLNELVSKGLVVVIGKKKCQYSNKKVAIYRINK